MISFFFFFCFCFFFPTQVLNVPHFSVSISFPPLTYTTSRYDTIPMIPWMFYVFLYSLEMNGASP